MVGDDRARTTLTPVPVPVEVVEVVLLEEKCGEAGVTATESANNKRELPACILMLPEMAFDGELCCVGRRT